MKSSARTVKHYRPLGLSIAIVATAILYGIFPLMPVVFLLLINTQGRTIGAELVDSLALLNAALGLLILAASVLAWLGRPQWARWILIALVVLATALRLYGVMQTIFSRTSSISEVGGNLSALAQPLAWCQLPLLILVPLYIAWYMNRAPARAFYTGRG
jgi:hypothetical protein